jgi:hypothetical protein
MVKMLYTPTMKFAKDAEGNLKPYPPTLKVQLRQRDGKFETVVYDDKKRPLTDVPLEDVLVKRSMLTVLIQCTGVWITGGKFGLSWKAVQIRADKIPDSIRGFAFLDEGESAPASAPVSAPLPVQQKRAPVAVPNTFQALADEEEIDDEEVFAASAPAARAAAPTFDDEADDVAPVALPKKVTTVKKIVTKAAAVPKK